MPLWGATFWHILYIYGDDGVVRRYDL